jgi:D-alanyl-D-alanine carboxypeptidase
MGELVPDHRRVIAAVDSVVHEVLATGWVPGMAVAVAQGSETVVLRGYGYADLTQRRPMTTETVLPFGSILKQFTAAAVLRWVDQGKLRLDDSVREFFPELPRDWQPVTIHHLLNHTSGIPRALAPEWAERARNTRAELLREIADRGPLEFPPGERWAYNNAAYVLLAMILEQQSGEPYDHHLRRTFLEPLGMNSTGNSDSIPHAFPRAMGYDTVQGRLQERPITGNSAAMGAGFYHATAGDLLVWQQALRSGRILRPETYGRMTSPTVLNSGESWPYGYALWLRDLDNGRRRVGHGGIQAGFRPYMGYLRDEDLSVVVLINSGAVDSWAVGESILRAVLMAQAAQDEISQEGDGSLPRPFNATQASAQINLYQVVMKPAQILRGWGRVGRSSGPSRGEQWQE